MIDQPVSEDTKSDAISMLRSGKKPSLKVVIDATHSGVLTNRRVYPASKVAVGYKSFFSKDNGGSAEVGIPLLTHHDDYKDPIGRVEFATFTALRSNMDFTHDYLNPDDVGGRGSGVVTIRGKVVNLDSIEKILDGRYLSVSAGHSTDKMICSVCALSIFSCDHIPGVRYDTEGERTSDESIRPCYVITNNMTYHETSFVNIPAQPPAKLIEFKWADADSYKGMEDIKDAFVSYTRGRKESVRELVLCDEDIELSLLTGKDKSTKTKTYFVPETTANRILEQLSETPKNESSKDRTSKVDGIQQIDQNKNIPTSIETIGDNMTDTIPSPELETLKTERDTLKDSLDTANEELKNLKDQAVTRDSTITSLTEEVNSLKVSLIDHLATALASYRIRLKKPDTVALDSEAKRKEYITNLSKRSIDSLRDSIADLLTEIDQTKETPTAVIVTEDKLESPTLGSKNKAKSKEKNSDDNALSAILD